MAKTKAKKREYLITFVWTGANEGDFIETALLTNKQAGQVASLLERAFADDKIMDNYYIGPPQRRPSTFSELQGTLSGAFGINLGGE